MKIIELNFKGCKYIAAIHKVLKDAFDFPDYYGENLDALWDCLQYYSNENIHVRIEGISALPDELDAYKQRMIVLFDMVHSTTPNITFSIIS